MRLRTVNVPYKTGDVFSLYPIGDVHLGSVNCDKDLFDATIKPPARSAARSVR